MVQFTPVFVPSRKTVEPWTGSFVFLLPVGAVDRGQHPLFAFCVLPHPGRVCFLTELTTFSTPGWGFMGGETLTPCFGPPVVGGPGIAHSGQFFGDMSV